jgi:hypothetical protein
MIKNIIYEKSPKSLRDRECAVCNKSIKKGEVYNLIKYRYDKTIMSFYRHDICKNEKIEII